MDILEQKAKSDFDSVILNLVNKLKFKNYPIEFKGSSSLKSQRYFSDYDLFTNITGKVDVEEAYSIFYKILETVFKSPDTYFIEYKIQLKNGEKFKWFPNETFDKDEFRKNFKDVDFIKIDLIVRIENRFIELSIIYKFSDTNLTKEQYIKSIKDDIKELEKEKNYYKILKRMFNIYKIEKKYDKLLYLTEIFNSPLGKLYQKISNLEAIDKILENYNDDFTLKKVELNLGEIKEPKDTKQIKKNIKKYKKELNSQAKEILDSLK